MSIIDATVSVLLEKNESHIIERIGELIKDNPEITPDEIAADLADELCSSEKYLSPAARSMDLVSEFGDDERAVDDLLRYLSADTLEDALINGIWGDFDGYGELSEELTELVKTKMGKAV